MIRVGSRVRYKDTFDDVSPQGVVVLEDRGYSGCSGDIRVKWDEDGSESWEDRFECEAIEAKPDDWWKVPEGERRKAKPFAAGEMKPGINAIAQLRETQRQDSEVRIWVAEKYHGLKVRKRLSPSRDRQKTLDIYAKILGGTPVKGGGGSKASKGRLKLAKVLASPEAILVAMGPLLHKTDLERVKTRLGWRARLLYLSKRPPAKRKIIRRHSRW